MGPHIVDRFANNNKHIRCVNSRFRNPEKEAVDTFTVDWENENIGLIPRLIQHARKTKAEGTLIDLQLMFTSI